MSKSSRLPLQGYIQRKENSIVGQDKPYYDNTFLLFEYGQLLYELCWVMDDAYAFLSTSGDTRMHSIYDLDEFSYVNYGED